MKLYFLISLFFVNQNIFSQDTEVKENLKCCHCKPHTSQIVFGGIANMLNHAGNIAGDPHNPDNVKQQVCGIFATLANMASQAIRNGDLEAMRDLRNLFDAFKAIKEKILIE